MLARILENLADRLTGPMSFRFVLQPVVACVFAVIAGLQDARFGKQPYNPAAPISRLVSAACSLPDLT